MVPVLIGQRGTLLSGALAAVLSAERDMLVVAEISRLDDLVTWACPGRPQVAVLDGRLPGTTSIRQACSGLRQAAPGCRPLVLLDRGAGAGPGQSLVELAPWLGLLTTDATLAELVVGIRRLASGAPVLDSGLVAAARAARGNPLTGRERDILRLSGAGAPPKAIASRLRLSVGTVRNHLSRGVTKLGARTRLEAIRTAQDAGWL